MSDVLQLAGYEPPDAYRKDTLRLMVRDAHTLYAYWEITDRKKWLASQHFQCDWSQLPKVLRLYDVTYITFNGHNANRVLDIELTPEAQDWYATGLGAGAVYMADLGVYTWERQFVPFLRSDPVRTPRDCPAGWGEPIVAVVPEASRSHSTSYIPPYDLEHFIPSR
ncbi:DUF4912 domain-containing protein [Paenibacillus flagellatus]|uniref:DUF4912 domain-containing protein n=1 Tax=Paenibacillus flagellatus TaxID=2211139 RepID=UPI001FEA39B0|nr:DUF4912 domain-containing protein [Paenibacillus flagellatus]